MPDYMTDTEQLLHEIVHELRGIREALGKISESNAPKTEFIMDENTKVWVESWVKEFRAVLDEKQRLLLELTRSGIATPPSA